MDNRSYWVLSFAKAGDRSTFLFNVGGGKVRSESKDATAAHRPWGQWHNSQCHPQKRICMYLCNWPPYLRALRGNQQARGTKVILWSLFKRERRSALFSYGASIKNASLLFKCACTKKSSALDQSSLCFGFYFKPFYRKRSYSIAPASIRFHWLKHFVAFGRQPFTFCTDSW